MAGKNPQRDPWTKSFSFQFADTGGFVEAANYKRWAENLTSEFSTKIRATPALVHFVLELKIIFNRNFKFIIKY